MTKSMKTVTRVTGIALLISAAVVLLTLIISAIAGNCTGLQALFSLCNIAIAPFGAAYLLAGANKTPGGKLFKTYLALNAISMLLCLFLPNKQFLYVAISITFAGYLVLTLSSDIGETKSKIIAVVISLILIYTCVYRIFVEHIPALAALGHIARVIIGVSVIVMIWAKYADKKARGTK